MAACLKRLKTPNLENINHERKVALVKGVVRKGAGKLGPIYIYIYISDPEHDVNVQQDRAYKTVKEPNKTGKNTLYVNLIINDDWLQYFKTLWPCTGDKSTKLIDCNEYVNFITKYELQDALKQCKSRKVLGSDGINGAKVA